MTTENQVPAKQEEKGLVVHQSYMYDIKSGVRLIYRGAKAWDPETDDEFLKRFTEAQDVSLDDLTRCCQLHPLIVQYAAAGKDYATVIHGTMQRVKYRELMRNAGFGDWTTFRAMTDWQCKGLKKLFELAQVAREEEKLARAEEALEKRAIDGVQEEVYTQSGKFAGTRTKYSDRLLEVHLKALDPDKYSEKHQLDVTGTVVSVHLGLRDGSESPMQAAEIVEEPLEDKG